MANAVKELQVSFSATTTVNNAQFHAKVLHTNFIVQHNISFLTADHLASKNFCCSRTKTKKKFEHCNGPTITFFISLRHGRKSF